MSKHKEAPEEEEETAPFWVISFSDMMTLLLTFFIMLFTMSTLEVEKVKVYAEALSEHFSGEGTPPPGKGRHPSKRPGFMPGNEAGKESKPTTLTLPAVHTEIETVKGGIVLFDLESDSLSEPAKKGLGEIIEQLRGIPNLIMLKGHASLKEQDTRNADDLAYTRCWNVREYLVSLGLHRGDFQMCVVGQNEPLDSSTLHRKLEPGQENSYVSISLLIDVKRIDSSDSP